MDVLDITNIEELDMRLRAKVRVAMEWKDSRLEFLNLRPDERDNLLHFEEQKKVN